MKGDAAEDTEGRQDARLDHGTKESSPGDPVSVKESKYVRGDVHGQ